MKRFQLLLIAVGALVLGLVFAQPVKATIQTQQDQIAINVTVQVVGTPVVGYVPNKAFGQGEKLTIASALRPAAPAVQREFRAEGIHFIGDSTVVAQAQGVQHGVLVQAEVTPNPKGTILVSNTPAVTMTAAPGQTVTLQPQCTLQVTVNMATAWSVEEGLVSDFVPPAPGDVTIPGKNLANNTYKQFASPLPTSTPYIVYANDGKVWSGLASGTTITTYCVDLTVTVPAGVTDGTYVTNAVYTLFN